MVKILAIESSCDETAAAVVADGTQVLSSTLYSQIAEHALYGGVVPEIASRRHVDHISQVTAAALLQAGITAADVDAIAVTCGPGLVGALLVGVSYAKGLAFAAKKPLIAVNHMAGHIAANRLANAKPPFLCLVVSGGHTELIHVHDWDSFSYLGGTTDDAAGEAFDKTARVLGLGYPGGSKIDALALAGNPSAYAFPRARLREDSLDFSFSGAKTAVLTHVQKHGADDIEDLCASVQAAIVDVLCQKTHMAAQKTGLRTIALAGGVAANSGLRRAMQAMCRANEYTLHIPDAATCTDNAAMIAAAGYSQYCKGNFAGMDLNADPSLSL